MRATEVIEHDCPHCGIKIAAFTRRGSYEYQIRKGPALQEIEFRCTHLFICPKCREGIVASSLAGEIEQIYPEIKRAIPAHLPANVERYYKQGLDNLGQNPDAAGMMFRKALEIGLGQKFASYKGSFNEVIKKAAANNEITKDISDWAHHIRKSGNSATHEDEYTPEQAEEMKHFTELVLTYIFTLPAKIAHHKTSDNQAE